MTAQDIIAAYFNAFNAGDGAAMLALVSDDVEHHVNQGEIRRGRAAFAAFCAHMGVSYREQLSDLVIFATADGARAAAEFTVHGTYLQTDPGLPEAHGQSYRLPAGSFFTLADGRITRITTYYNLQDWIAQVSP
ncbi:MAG: Ketosteroid isomerase-related protein [Rhodobacteraceae bacterium HLUCCA12]|nr:MAG: Ketosteroid isomerase-related protein [Rhodobacteraceae bacterium HLUCCA12]